MEAASGAAAAAAGGTGTTGTTGVTGVTGVTGATPGLLGAASSSSGHDDRGLRVRHPECCLLEDEDVVPELAYIHPRERPDWEETISAMARSADIPELRSDSLMRSSSSSSASMKVKTVKKLCFSKAHFPKLAECAHFHYENVDFGTIQLSLGDEQNEITRNGFESKELVYLVNIYCQGRSWTVRRSYEDFRVLDKHLHLCIYDRRFSQLAELPRLDNLDDQSESVSQVLLAYLARLSVIADNKINCGPALTWMEVDNKGNHLLVHEESSINVPAIAAAHVIKRYIGQAADELSFEVGDIVSVIDMPPKEDTTWWRGKHGFQVGFFPSECVELINDKVPQSMSNAAPKPASPCSGLQPPPSWSLFPPYLELDSVLQETVWVADPLNHYSLNSVSRKNGKLITFLRSFMKSRPSKQKLKQRGILKERVFGCDLGEHLLNSGYDVPQVLKSCTEFIEKHGVVDGIYRLSGIASNIQKLRHEFDSEQVPDLTKDVYVQDIHCVGSLCKLYFRELPNPLLSYQLYDKFSEAVSAATDEERLIKIHDVIQQLPPPHYRTLEFLMRHLSRLAAFSYITNMHSKNLAIVWAPNLLRSRQIESACFSGSAAFMEVRIQSVVVEFILNHVEVLFSSKLSLLIRDGGPPSLARPKSLLVSTPTTRLLSLEEAQARTQAQINSPVTDDSKYIEVGEGPAALQGKFHTVIQFPAERKRAPIKSRKSPVGSWRSFFNLGIKSSSVSKRKLQRNPSEPSELKALALPGGRGDTATLRSAKSEESLSSLHNVEGESRLFRPRRPRSSSDALSASFNGDLLDGLEALKAPPGGAEGDDGDGPLCIPALISPPRPGAGEDVDLSPPDVGMASLDFDPMSFQCSSVGPDAPLEGGAAESPRGLEESPGTPPAPPGTPPPPAKAGGLKRGGSYADKPTQAVPPIKSGGAPDEETADRAAPGGPGRPSTPKDPPALVDEPSPTETLHSKMAAVDGPHDPPGASIPDPWKDLPPRPLGAPPPPPPKSAARMLALVLAESALQAPDPPTPGSPVPSQEPASPQDPVRHPQGPAWPPQDQSRPPQVSAWPPQDQSRPPQDQGRPPQDPGRAPQDQGPAWPPQDQGPAWPPQDQGPALAPQGGPLVPQHPATSVPEAPGSVTRPPDAEAPPLAAPPPPTSPPRTRVPLPVSTNPTPSTRTGPDQQPPLSGRVPAPPSPSGASAPPSGHGRNDGEVSFQPAPEVRPETPAAPPVVLKPPDPPPAAQKPKQQAVSPTRQQQNQNQQQHQNQNHLPAHPPSLLPSQPQNRTPVSKASARVAPTSAEPLEKPWEAIKPVQPCTGSKPVQPCTGSKPVQPCTGSKHHDPYGPGPPTPPIRTLESKLAAAVLSQADVSYQILDEPGGHFPLSPCKPLAHQPGYLYHANAELAELYHAKAELAEPQPAYLYHAKAELAEPQLAACYHQRPIPVGPQSFPHHYRPDNVSTHAYVCKSEPQLPYRANRYSTLGPRSYHHSVKLAGNPQGVYVSAGPGRYDRIHGCPTIRRVHSLHVPPTIRSTPVQRTEVPPDDELFFYHRPAYPCYQQQPPPPAAQGTDYHVTQLQPYFENGRVQYRYSPYSGSGPEEADAFATIRVRHFQSCGGRDATTAAGAGRPGGKATGYHYLARSVLPPGKEHSFVSRDMPPGRRGNAAANAAAATGSYLTWDPKEAERLRMHSLRRESRTRLKVKGHILSQYDNVGPFPPLSGYETLHLRSKSDPGKALLLAGHDSRHADPDVLAFTDPDTLLYGGKADSLSRKCPSSHSVPAGLSRGGGCYQPDGCRHDAGDGSRSKHRQDFQRNLQPRYDGPDSDDPPGRCKPERSQSVREENRYGQSQPDPDRDYAYQKPGTKPVQSHYDNLDDYHPGPQAPVPLVPQQHQLPQGALVPLVPPVPGQKQGGPGSYPAPVPASLSSRAYSTALGQGAFIQTELGLQRLEAPVHTE
ncbi:rho GTPase-activating protein 32 isoform X3 [Cololabis saira]|uniref:rho GTPase-activating protein 32 isoform X3 n=1 Tax=Cololabis saira TaxID=129043 RepID=UPI002AD2806C|nr:rho GTPase-activating protein 32 isoform X3 [Cololabis saira]